MHKLSSSDLATVKKLWKKISLLALLELGQKWDVCSVRKENEVKDQAKLEPATTGLHPSYKEVLLCKQEPWWNLTLWSEKMHDFKTAAAKEKKGRWYLMALSSKDLEISTCVACFHWQKSQALDHSVAHDCYTSSQFKIVALQSVYCPSALVWQYPPGTGRSIWKRRWRTNRPFTDPNLTNSMQSVSLKICRFFLSKPHRIC